MKKKIKNIIGRILFGNQYDYIPPTRREWIIGILIIPLIPVIIVALAIWLFFKFVIIGDKYC